MEESLTTKTNHEFALIDGYLGAGQEHEEPEIMASNNAKDTPLRSQAANSVAGIREDGAVTPVDARRICSDRRLLRCRARTRRARNCSEQ
jgi:hypothetical protein